MKELVVKYVQCNSEGFHILPSKYGLGICRAKFAQQKIRYDEVEVTFGGVKVRAFKIIIEGRPKFFHQEARFETHSTSPNSIKFYIWTTLESRVEFTVPLFVDVVTKSDDTPTEQSQQST